jgi:hypothetical protein
MPIYDIELIHEPTGAYVSFEYESEESEDDVWQEIISDISVMAFARGD